MKITEQLIVVDTIARKIRRSYRAGQEYRLQMSAFVHLAAPLGLYLGSGSRAD